MINFHQFIEEKLDLKELGFHRIQARKGDELSIYVRDSKERVDRLTFPLFTEGEKGEGLFIGYERTIQSVIFPGINAIFEKAQIQDLKSTWIIGEEVYRNTDKVLSYKHPNWDKQLNKYPKISKNLLTSDNQIDEKQANEACRILRQIVENEILPFYKMYPDLQSVNDEIINCYEELRDLVKYISTLTPFKKMIIMHETNNPNYWNYIEGYEMQLQKAVETNKEKYYPSYCFFKNLRIVLDNRKK